MKVYRENIKTIIQTQYNDPLLIHLSNKIISHLKLAEGKQLLDIGCGVGRTSFMAALQGFDVIGVDIEKKAIDIAKTTAKKLNLENKCIFDYGDILKQKKLYNKKFDVIICSEVIEHVLHPQKIINLAFRLLKKNGLFIITTPHDPKLWSVLDNYADHIKRFSTGELKRLLSNFKVVNFYTIGFPFMRSVICFYDFITRVVNIKHTSSLRKHSVKNTIYSTVIGILLNFDDLFNSINKGTTIVVIAKKN